MNKTVILIILAVFCLKTSFGQEDCTELKNQLSQKEQIITKQLSDIKEKNATIDNQKIEILRLKKDIQYYKETLDLLDSKISTENKNVSFKINAITGNTNTGEVLIEGILINNGPLRSIQKQKSENFDPKGNKETTYNMTIGGDDTRIEKLYKDVPIKFAVSFKQLIEETPLIKILTMTFYSSIANTYKVTSKN
ncbi:MAG: hypothetical protein ACK5M7_09670 [Draconibacterium sp.]